MPRGQNSRSTKRSKTNSRNSFLRNRTKSVTFNWQGNDIVISPETKCVPAVHTARSKSTTGNKRHPYTYTWLEDSKHYAVTENGYMISFESSRQTKITGTPDNGDEGYVNVWGGTVRKANKETGEPSIVNPTEKLHRVIWFSFALDAIKNGTDFPSYVADMGDDLYFSGNGDRLNRAELKQLLTMPAEKYGGMVPTSAKCQYVVHHKDLNENNNEISNLELMPWYLHEMAANGSIHNSIRGFNRAGIKISKAEVGVATKDSGIFQELSKFVWRRATDGTTKEQLLKRCESRQSNEEI